MAGQTTRMRDGAPFPALDAVSNGASSPPALAALGPFKTLVKRLSESFGPPGGEEAVRDLVREHVRTLVDNVRLDALGNLIATRRGNGNGRRKKLMLAAPLDEPGLMVTFVDSRGFMRVGALGDVHSAAVPGARVRFANGVVGVLARDEDATQENLASLFLDVGAPGENAPRVGDPACFVGEFADAGDFLIGKALGNRLACAVVIETLRQLTKCPHDVSFVFTVQHSLGARGAGVAAFGIQPEAALVVHATSAGDVPGGDAGALGLGRGPVVQFKDEAMIASASMRGALVQAARDAHVPFQVQAAPGTGGDGAPIQAAREGIPTAALAIPVRYSGTASEMAHQSDALSAARLLLALLTRPL